MKGDTGKIKALHLFVISDVIGITSRLARLGKFSQNFSSSPFVIHVNLLTSLTICRDSDYHISGDFSSANYYFQLSFYFIDNNLRDQGGGGFAQFYDLHSLILNICRIN